MTDTKPPHAQNTERDGSQPIEWQNEKSHTSVQQEPSSGRRDVESDVERLEDSA